MQPTAIVWIQDENFQGIFFNIETLLIPGVDGNSGPLLLPLVKLSTWNLF
jgi:hypothetical protein